MLQTSQTDYTSVLSEFIQSQVVIFGPQVVHLKIDGIKGLVCDREGVVKKLTGDPQSILQEVSNNLSELSEFAVKTVLDRIVRNHTTNSPAVKPDMSQLNNSQQDIISRINPNA